MSSRSSKQINDLLDTDVICAQNKQAAGHPGNRRYQQIVLLHREAYQNARRREDKSSLTSAVIQKVKESGGRFVKFDRKRRQWKEIDSASLHDKVSHALRSSTKQEKQKRIQQRAQQNNLRPENEKQTGFEGHAVPSGAPSAVVATKTPCNILEEPLPLTNHKKRTQFQDEFRGSKRRQVQWLKQERQRSRSEGYAVPLDAPSTAEPAVGINSKSLSPIKLEALPGAKRSSNGMASSMGLFRSLSHSILEDFAKSWARKSAATVGAVDSMEPLNLSQPSRLDSTFLMLGEFFRSRTHSFLSGVGWNKSTEDEELGSKTTAVAL